MPKKGKQGKPSKKKTDKVIPMKAGAKAKQSKGGNVYVVPEGTGTGGPGSRGGKGSYKERRPANSRDRLRSGGMLAEDLSGIVRDREQGSALRRRLGGGSLASGFPSNTGLTGSIDVVRREDDKVFAEQVIIQAKRQAEQERLKTEQNQRRADAINEANIRQEEIRNQPQERVGRIIEAGGVLSPRGRRFPEPQRTREQARKQNNPEQAIRQVGGEVQVDTNRLIPWRGGTRSISQRTSDEGAKFRIRENREDQIRRIITTPSPLTPAKPPPIEEIIITRSNAPPPPSQDYKAKTLRMRKLYYPEGKTREDFKKFQEERELQRTRLELARGDALSGEIDTLFNRDTATDESDFESDFTGDTSEDIPTIPEDREAERQTRRQARREALFPDPLREFRVEPRPPPVPSPARAGIPQPIQPQRAEGDLTQFLVNQPRTIRDIDPRYRLSVSDEAGFKFPPMIYNPSGDAPITPLDRGGIPALLPRRPEEERYARLQEELKEQSKQIRDPLYKPKKKDRNNLNKYNEDPNFKPFDTPSSEEIVNTPRRRRPRNIGQGPKPSSPRPAGSRPGRPRQFEEGAEAYETPSDLSTNYISTDESGERTGGDAEFRRSRRQDKIDAKKLKQQRRQQFIEESQTDTEAVASSKATESEFKDARKELKKQLNQGAIQESIQAQAGGGRARRGEAKQKLSSELQEEAGQLETEIKNIKRQLSVKGIQRGDIAKSATKKAQPGIVQRLRELGLLDEADTEALLERLFLAMRRQQQIRNIKK